MSSCAPLEAINPSVETPFDLSEDQKRRLVRMVLGNGHADHRGMFTIDGGENALELAAIHLTDDLAAAKAGSESALAGIDDITFDIPVHVLLADAAGETYGWKRCRAAVRSAWHFGVLFEADGDVFFCGKDNPGGDYRSPQDESPMTLADAPVLVRVSGMASAEIGAEPFDLAPDLPCEGEVWISRDDLPCVVSMPWWSGYAVAPEEGASEARRKLARDEIDQLALMVERARALSPQPDASPEAFS